MFNLNWLGTCSYPVHWLVVTGVRACQKLRSLKMFTFFSHGCRLILMGTDSFSPLAILSQSSRFEPWFTRVTRLLFYMKKPCNDKNRTRTKHGMPDWFNLEKWGFLPLNFDAVSQLHLSSTFTEWKVTSEGCVYGNFWHKVLIFGQQAFLKLVK